LNAKIKKQDAELAKLRAVAEAATAYVHSDDGVEELPTDDEVDRMEATYKALVEALAALGGDDA